ncbi:hypothetical protein [Corynebacterium sp. p3-SID1056]|uniref:hypothetical protein n=1 Tax=Corynebacterium sp. p3-SID1056 TaxID=2916092 RepID=UPI0021A66870|nr:hypothetical protein [Corynebacterium sp. p3-SID1056]MCT2339122.1 hypothetical protein [Corynebacterium sp. p3-SID1056]
MDRILKSSSGDDLLLDRAILQAERLAEEVIAVNHRLIAEIERDRKLMAGIQKRDKEIARLKSELEAARSDASLKTRVLKFKPGGGKLLHRLRLGCLLPASLRGTDVPAPILRLKRMYWASK